MAIKIGDRQKLKANQWQRNCKKACKFEKKKKKRRKENLFKKTDWKKPKICVRCAVCTEVDRAGSNRQSMPWVWSELGEFLEFHQFAGSENPLYENFVLHIKIIIHASPLEDKQHISCLLLCKGFQVVTASTFGWDGIKIICRKFVRNTFN